MPLGAVKPRNLRGTLVGAPRAQMRQSTPRSRKKRATTYLGARGVQET